MSCKHCKFIARVKKYAGPSGKVVILDHILASDGLYRLYVIPMAMDIVQFNGWPHKQKNCYWVENLKAFPTSCTCVIPPDEYKRASECSLFPRSPRPRSHR